MPPVLSGGLQRSRKKSRDKGFGSVTLANDFYAVGGVAAGSQVGDESLANAPPTGFFATPLNAAAGPRQFLPIKQTAARANNSVRQVSARTLKEMTRGPGMLRFLR